MGEARPLFQVKICGITVPADAEVAARCGADAIGINFVAGSPRCVDVATARELAAAAGPDVLLVGVFAGMPAEEIAAMRALKAAWDPAGLMNPGVLFA